MNFALSYTIQYTQIKIFPCNITKNHKSLLQRHRFKNTPNRRFSSLRSFKLANHISRLRGCARMLSGAARKGSSESFRIVSIEQWASHLEVYLPASGCAIRWLIKFGCNKIETKSIRILIFSHKFYCICSHIKWTYLIQIDENPLDLNLSWNLYSTSIAHSQNKTYHKCTQAAGTAVPRKKYFNATIYRASVKEESSHTFAQSCDRGQVR